MTEYNDFNPRFNLTQEMLSDANNSIGFFIKMKKVLLGITTQISN